MNISEEIENRIAELRWALLTFNDERTDENYEYVKERFEKVGMVAEDIKSLQI